MGARGEGTIQAGDREVVVLFTNRALAEAEQAIGQPILKVARTFADGESGVFDVVHLLRAGMEAARRDAGSAGRPVSMTQAYKVLDEAGFSAVAATVMVAIAAVLSYSPEAEADEDAASSTDPNL